MRDIKWHVVPCLLSTALLGCGTVAKPTSGIPIDQAPAEIAETVCPRAYECCTATQLMGNKDLAGTDEPSCEMKTTEGFGMQLANVSASERMGRSMYDADKLAACLATIRSSSCQSLQTTNHLVGVPGCDSFVMPLVKAGEACTFDWECIAGWCHTPSGGGTGTCQAPLAAGQACADNKCGGSLTCDGQTSTCVQPAPATNTCFYASGCALAGAGRPTLLSLAALGAVLGAALRRRRRRN